MIQKLNERLQR